jgi:uncharacterized protein YbjQ (UPF0145 family)
MTLNGMESLDSTLTKKWQQVTGNHLQVEIIQMLGDNVGDSVKVNVSLTSQTSRRALGRNALRSLQTQTTELTFDSIISIQSEVQEYNADHYIVDSFATEKQKASYVASLTKSDDFFENATLESVTSGPTLSQLVESPQNDHTVTSIGFIAGMAAAGVAIIGLFALFQMRQLQKKRKSQDLQTESHLEGADSSIGSDSRGPLILEDDDSFYVITQRDSVRRPDPRVEESVYGSTSSSITVDFYFDDITEHNPSTSVLDLQSHQSETSTREFEVVVPAGNLGLVLGTNDKGTPFVQEIKSSSPLYEEVQVGDQLIIVDGMDVTMLGTASLSILVRAKMDKSVRRFVFARPEGNK